MSSISGFGQPWPQTGTQGPGQTGFTPEIGTTQGPAKGGGESFGKVLSSFVNEVDSTQKASEAETRRILLGETDNLHQAMLASQESKVALTLLVEVRNKLVEGFQEVMRMQV
ncbi:MAG: flagellar hook-basal body complex protein FliE [Opitutales bacterium]